MKSNIKRFIKRTIDFQKAGNRIQESNMTCSGQHSMRNQGHPLIREVSRILRYHRQNTFATSSEYLFQNSQRQFYNPGSSPGENGLLRRERDNRPLTLSALCNKLYEKSFRALVERVNRALDRPSSKSTFIGILDIARFEISDKNGYEQPLVNYTKLGMKTRDAVHLRNARKARFLARLWGR